MIIHPSSVCFDKQFHFILVILKRRKVSYYTNTTISLCGSGIQRSRLCRYTETRRSAYRFSIDAMALTADNVTGKTAGPENLTFHYVYSCLWLPLEHRETPDPPIHPRCADGRYPPRTTTPCRWWPPRCRYTGFRNPSPLFTLPS